MSSVCSTLPTTSQGVLELSRTRASFWMPGHRDEARAIASWHSLGVRVWHSTSNATVGVTGMRLRSERRWTVCTGYPRLCSTHLRVSSKRASCPYITMDICVAFIVPPQRPKVGDTCEFGLSASVFRWVADRRRIRLAVAIPAHKPNDVHSERLNAGTRI